MPGRHSGQFDVLLHIAILHNDSDPRRADVDDAFMPGDSLLLSLLKACILLCRFAELQVVCAKRELMRPVALASGCTITSCGSSF